MEGRSVVGMVGMVARVLVLSLVLVACGASVVAKEPDVVFPVVDGRIEYSEVVPADGVGAAELAKRANRAVANIFRSYKDVTNYADETMVKATGSIILPERASDPTLRLTFTVTIEFKDGRYRVTIGGLDVYCTSCGGRMTMYDGAFETALLKDGMKPKTGRAFQVAETDRMMKGVMELIKQEMSKPSDGSTSDW